MIEIIAQAVENGANFVNINLEKTPLDNLCCMNIFGQIDDVFELLMVKLGYEIPEWKLQRRLMICTTPEKNIINITGIDFNKTCFTLYKSITITNLAHTV